MPRRQRDLDPDGGPATELARDLRELRARAGDPKFDTMARRTGRSKTALAEAAGGRRLPRWETVEDFVRACDADPARWRGRWEAARSRTGTTGTTPAPPPVDASPTGTPTPTPTEHASEHANSSASPTPSEHASTAGSPPAPAPTRRHTDRGGARWLVVGAVVAVVLAAGVGFAVGRETASPYAPIGPLLRAVEVQNKVALGAESLVEDRTPAYLSTLPLAYCASPSRSCKVAGTEFGSGVGLVANCVTAGQRMWNYDLGEAAADDNPHRVESDLWYRASFPDGRSGYLSEVYLTSASRGGLGLPECDPS